MNLIQRAKKFRTKKHLGQNFLTDSNAVNSIISAANITPDDTVLEIGAGIGFMTEHIAKYAKKVYAVEIDTYAIKELQKLPFKNIEIIEKDILKTDISQYKTDKPLKIIANIPYYITSPILAHLLGEIDDTDNKNRSAVSEIFLMVQLEVANRIVADSKSKNKEYGLLSILCNFNADTEFLLKVPSGSFYPAPKVDSAVVKITPSVKSKYNPQNITMLKKILKAAFQTRRKTLKNSLSIGGFEKEIINKVFNNLNLSDTIRGETLSIEDFCNLSNEFDTQKKEGF
ncbi:MAG: 16S rRNA (adenine(1518)-N(6)/adenine(1519)-N(6))-dimethyltransferase RsmA [Candidatus Gastranaerophilales bacterium]|nr:16S rRNA (adenine(1518)-N(6)/adenine(1519)-N(6))-dimethyltransferase RsmA [Candidatus Gastranaerophilales bacterium]